MAMLGEKVPVKYSLTRNMLTKNQKSAAEMYALGCISWEDIEYLCGKMTPGVEKEIKDYAEMYARDYASYCLEHCLKSSQGVKELQTHARLIAEEYDTDVSDLRVTTVLTSLRVYVATGLIIL